MQESSKFPNLMEYLSHESKWIKLLDNLEVWRNIPLLNYTPLHELEDLSMVRFRGMIQDMLDPEIYLESYEVISTNSHNSSRLQNGKYRDCLVLEPKECVNFESKLNVHGERRTMFVVSLPAINPWASAAEENICSKQKHSPFTAETPLAKIEKRPATVDDSEMMDIDRRSTIEQQTKRQCTEDTQSSSHTVSSISSLSTEYLLNSPIPDRPCKACMIKLYSDFDSYPLNSMVDVVGFLSVDPALDGSSADTEFENCNEVRAQNPPPSLIPRLHAIAVRKLLHSNPLLDPSISEIIAPDVNFVSVYKDLKILLTQCLLGDGLAAEYLIAHLISTIYIRSDLHNIGKFALNICNLPQEVLPTYTRNLYEILELFLPASHYLAMTLDNVNTFQFFPKKDYETNKLTSGILQLAPHTHLVLDETKMQTGKLEANGVRGIQNLAHFIKSQEIKCNFHYYDIDFNMDIPVLILSEGRSMLPSDFVVPLNVDVDYIAFIDESLKAAKHYAQPKLDAIRRYLTSAKMYNFGINPADSEMVQTDFVNMRKANANVGADELHGLLVLSRLLAIANGKSTLDKECWEMSKSMETLRRNRLENMPKSNRN